MQTVCAGQGLQHSHTCETFAKVLLTDGCHICFMQLTDLSESSDRNDVGGEVTSRFYEAANRGLAVLAAPEYSPPTPKK